MIKYKLSITTLVTTKGMTFTHLSIFPSKSIHHPLTYLPLHLSICSSHTFDDGMERATVWKAEFLAGLLAQAY